VRSGCVIRNSAPSHTTPARKKPMLPTINIENRLTFAIKMQHQPEDYWNNVIFCDETKMMYYNDGPNRVWRKALTALGNRNIIPPVKFGKLSVMIWECISSRGAGDLAFIGNTMNAEQYLNILKCNLTSSAKKVGFYKNPIKNFLTNCI